MNNGIILAIFCYIQLSLAFNSQQCEKPRRTELQDQVVFDQRLMYDQCALENDVTTDEVDRFLLRDLTFQTQNIKLFFICISQRLGLIDANDNILYDKTQYFWANVMGNSEERVHNSIEFCKREQIVDHIERSWQEYICYVEHGFLRVTDVKH